MTRKEFIKGMLVITIVVCLYYTFGHPVYETTKEVKITKIEKVSATTDEYGNVEVIVE